MSAEAPTYAGLASPLYPPAPPERRFALLAKQDIEHAAEDGEYDVRRSYVLDRIAREVVAGGRALRAAGFDPRAKGFVPVVSDTSETLHHYRVEPSALGVDPVWTYRQRQLALAAVFEGDDARLNAAADALQDRIARERSAQWQGPAMDDQHFDAADDLGIGNPAGLALLHFEAEDTLKELIVREGGRIVEAHLAAEAEAAFRLNNDYTEKLAAACERAGLRVRCVDPGEANPEGRPVRPSVTFIPFGEPARALRLPNVQRLNFFPSVAAADRAPIARALAYVLQREPFARMATLTSGPRDRDDARLPNLRQGTRAFHRRLGLLFKHRWFTRHASLLLRATEYGTPKAHAEAWQLDGGMPCPSALRWDFNIHGHIIYIPEKNVYRVAGQEVRRMWTPAQWGRFREWIRLRLAALARFQAAQVETPRLAWADFRAADRAEFRAGRAASADYRQPQHHAELGKMIRKAAEAVKYPMKNTDLEAMVELGGDAVVRDFAEQTKSLHLVQPLGELAALRRRLSERGERIVRITTPEGGILVIRRDWNRPAPANPNAPDFMGGKGRAARLARLRRALDPRRIARAERKISRKTERAARDLLAKVQDESKRLARLSASLAKAESARDYWAARASAWSLENRATATHRAETLQAAASERAESLAAARADCATREKDNARAFVALLERFPHALHAAGIDALPAAVLRMMERMGAFCALAQNEENDTQNDPKTTEPAKARPIANRLLAITSPCAIGGARVTQPFAVVVGYQGNFADLAGQSQRVREVADLTRAQLTAGLRIAAELDLAPRSARPARPLRGSHYPPNFPRGSETESAPPPLQAEFSGLAEPVLAALATL
jgi:hypothetical protein